MKHIKRIEDAINRMARSATELPLSEDFKKTVLDCQTLVAVIRKHAMLGGQVSLADVLIEAGISNE